MAVAKGAEAAGSISAPALFVVSKPQMNSMLTTSALPSHAISCGAKYVFAWAIVSYS